MTKSMNVGTQQGFLGLVSIRDEAWTVFAITRR